MQLEFRKAGKRFNREWIFRKVELVFNSGSKNAILGGNGSGKSTFLKCCSAYYSLSKGELIYSDSQGVEVKPDDVFRHIAITAPYLDLPGLFTLRETIDFHFRLKKAINDYKTEDLIELSGLGVHADKPYRNFSSGMKQRVKLLLAICSDSELLLIDEPGTNLDKNGISWYRKLLNDHLNNRTLIIASNHYSEEYDMCERIIEVRDFK